MKLTKLQLKTLKFYAKYQTEPLTMLRMVRSFWLMWLLLLIPVGLGCWYLSSDWPGFGWLCIGASAGAFLRDINRILSLSRTWPAIHETINWQRLQELVQSNEKA